MRWRYSTRSDGFGNCKTQWSVLHIAGDAPRRSGARFDSTAAAGRENNHRRAGGIINGEREKKLPLNRDLLFNQNRFDWKLSNFHRQHARRVSANLIWLFGEGDPAYASASSAPSLDLDDHFAAFVARGELLSCRHSFIRG